MMATPRTTCGQNISAKSAVRGCERAHREPSCEQRKADRGQRARIDAAFQHHHAGCGDQLGHAGDQHDRADLEGAVLPHEGEEHRHQIDRAEQPDTEAEAQGAAERERAALQAVEPQDRMHAPAGSAGSTARRWTRLSANSAMQVGDSQPRCGASFRPISRLASATASSAMARRSSFDEFARSVGCRGNRPRRRRRTDQARARH